MFATLTDFHARVFCMAGKHLDPWLTGLALRLIFASVLVGYYLNSALTKVGTGFPGVLFPGPSAYFQIVPQAVEAAGYDPQAVAFLPWGLMVWAGTYAEFILPVLIVIGLFTRLASLGMIGFIAVQTLVDMLFHGADATVVGALFDRFPDAMISDQRLLWVGLLLVLVLRGAGLVSLDALLGRRFALTPVREGLPGA